MIQKTVLIFNLLPHIENIKHTKENIHSPSGSENKNQSGKYGVNNNVYFLIGSISDIGNIIFNHLNKIKLLLLKKI